MWKFIRQKSNSELNIKLGRLVEKSGLLDKESLQHLSSLIRTSGPSGASLRTYWPSDQVHSVQKWSLKLVDKWFANPAAESKVDAAQCTIDLEQTIEELTIKLSIDDSVHPYQTPLVFSIGELICQKRNNLKAEEAVQIVEIGLTLIIGMRWFPKWSEANIQTLNSQLTFTNLGALEMYRDSVSKSIEQNEIPLNAGTSYMLNQGNTGDGTLIATNRRLIFAFDEDYKRSSQSFMLKNITSFSFIETSVVPMSKELTIHFRDRDFSNSVKFYVGNFYSVELTNLFKTFGH